MIWPTKQAKRDKHLLELEREYHRLCRVSAKAPLIALETPYQRGWVKSFVLREDVLRRRDASTFRSILAAINVSIYSRNGSFIDRNRNRMTLHPKIIPAREWPKLQWPENHKRHFFFGYWKQPIWNFAWSYERYVFGYKLGCEYILEEHTLPFMVTHVRTELPAVRKRMTEIDQIFTHRKGRERLGRLHGHRQRYWNQFSWSRDELRSRANALEASEGRFEPE